MASSFGVQLKKRDESQGSSPSKGIGRTPGGARRSDFRTQPVSDLKAMFDKNDESAGKKNISSTVSTQKSSVTKTEFSATKPGLSGTKTTSTIQTTKTQSSSSKLSDGDMEAFNVLRSKLTKTGIEKLLEDEQPNVAVAKTFSGGNTYQATVGVKKVHSANDDASGGVVTKSDAVSALSFGLTKLRTRPNSLKGDEEKLPRHNSIEEEVEKSLSSPRQSYHRPDSPGLRDLKDNKYIPGVAKGWKSNSPETKEKDKTGKFNDSSVGKLRKEVKQEKIVKGFRSVSPVNFSVNSSDDSSSSSNLSPRGYRSNNVKSEDKKTDVNENIRKFESSKSDSNLLSWEKNDNQNKVNTESSLSKKLITSSTSKLSAVEKISVDKEKVKSRLNRNSGSFSSDSDKGKRSPKVKGEMKWVEKGRISLEEFKEQNKVKGEGHRPLSRASSSGSNSSFKQSEVKAFQSKIERFSSPEPPKDAAKGREGLSEVKRKDYSASRKMSTDKFQDIKKGFETQTVATRTKSPASDRKPKIDIKQKVLERKQSFEEGVVYRPKSVERKEIISPRDRGNVLKTVQALKDLDAKAKKQPTIVRRTKSLPIENLGDDGSSIEYEDISEGPYYHDVVGVKLGDDISNEGDISSEADLYEEIPANMSIEDQGNAEIHLYSQFRF